MENTFIDRNWDLFPLFVAWSHCILKHVDVVESAEAGAEGGAGRPCGRPRYRRKTCHTATLPHAKSVPV